MNDDVLIKVEGVSKKFCKSLKKSMLYGIEDIVRDTLNLKITSDKLRKNEFWAVRDVSFEVKRGECIGIIGRNGAGKSTLLKMLNGIFMPDEGSITIKGNVSALIEVGAGFHPMLTGRENIYVNGAILGMSKKEIDSKFDEIVEFSELGDFIDMPVKRYSSGMYVRLGFAIAVQVKPDVLILDEVLAVGDIGFRLKCYAAMAKFQQKCAIIIVSHSMATIGKIANKVLSLKKGGIIFLGDTNKAILHYESLTDNKVELINADIQLNTIAILNKWGKKINHIKYSDPITIKVNINVIKKIKNPIINFHFTDIYNNYVFQTNSEINEVNLNSFDCREYEINIEIPFVFLNSGKYLCSFTILNKNNPELLCLAHNVLPFEVRGSSKGISVYQGKSNWLIEEK